MNIITILIMMTMANVLRIFLIAVIFDPQTKKIVISMEVSPIFANRYEQKNAAKVAKATKNKKKNIL